MPKTRQRLALFPLFVTVAYMLNTGWTAYLEHDTRALRADLTRAERANAEIRRAVDARGGEIETLRRDVDRLKAELAAVKPDPVR